MCEKNLLKILNLWKIKNINFIITCIFMKDKMQKISTFY